jgi:hypothetical protein
MTTTTRRYSGAEQRMRPHTGMSVVCQEGLVGYVERSLPTWQPEQPTHVVVRTGEHSDQQVIVPAHWVAHVTPAEVMLNVRKRHIARRARYQTR